MNQAESKPAPDAHKAQGQNDKQGQGHKQAFPEDIRPAGIDVDNDYSSDSTVDTDGKDHDAKRLGRLEDSEVVSNATEANSTPTPPEGLAGIDSRHGGDSPGVLAEDGKQVVDLGITDSVRLYETAGDESDATQERKEKEHLPPNHARAARKIRIE